MIKIIQIGLSHIFEMRFPFKCFAKNVRVVLPDPILPATAMHYGVVIL
jgi:hypothetical protein